MKKVITDNNGIVLDIVDRTEAVINGLQVWKGEETYIFASILSVNESEIVEVPTGVGVMTHRYIEGVFSKNPNYREVLTPMQEIDRLKALLEDATMLLIESGVL